MQRKKSKVVPINRVTHAGTFDGTGRRRLRTRSPLKPFSVFFGVEVSFAICLFGYLSSSVLLSHAALACASKDL